MSDFYIEKYNLGSSSITFENVNSGDFLCIFLSCLSYSELSSFTVDGFTEIETFNEPVPLQTINGIPPEVYEGEAIPSDSYLPRFAPLEGSVYGPLISIWGFQADANYASLEVDFSYSGSITTANNDVMLLGIRVTEPNKQTPGESLTSEYIGCQSSSYIHTGVMNGFKEALTIYSGIYAASGGPSNTDPTVDIVKNDRTVLFDTRSSGFGNYCKLALNTGEDTNIISTISHSILGSYNPSGETIIVNNGVTLPLIYFNETGYFFAHTWVSYMHYDPETWPTVTYDRYPFPHRWHSITFFFNKGNIGWKIGYI